MQTQYYQRKDKLRANQRAAKARIRIARGESELSEELRWLVAMRTPTRRQGIMNPA